MESIKKVRIAAYIRVSTDEQARSGFGLETQLRHILNEVDRNKDKGWSLDEQFIYKDDGYSGSLKSRPALNRMLEDAKEKKFDILITWKIDRLYRQMRLLLETMDELGKCSVNYKSVTEPFDTTAVGNFIFQMFGALAELERNIILIRTTEGKISSAKGGNFVGGNVPYGYRIVDKKLIVLPDEAEIVRKVFVWYTQFDYAVSNIAVRLTKLQVPGKHDHKGAKSKRRTNPANFWGQSMVQGILKRTEYIGEYCYNKTGVKDGKTYIKPKTEWVIFTCPAIVDSDIFQKAQDKMKRGAMRSNNARTKYLFSTKIHCGLCDSIFTGYTSTKKTKNYRCGKNNKTKTGILCKARHISEVILKDLLWSKMLVFLQQPERELNKIIKQVSQTSYYRSLVGDKMLLEKRERKNQNARMAVKQAFRDGVYTTEELAEELEIIDREYGDITEQLKAINAQLTTEEEKKEKINSLKEVAEKYQRHLDDITYDGMYEVIQALVKRIIIKGEDIQLELQVPRETVDRKIKSKLDCGSTKEDRTPISTLKG